MTKQNIMLVGFMGTGKTTVGRMLAEQTKWNFIDTDQWIEEKAAMSIPEIFSQYGETRFRDLETSALQHVLTYSQQIITTGGGAVIRESNRQLMAESGVVIALQARIETIAKRVRQDVKRPLLQGNVEEKINTLLEQRKGMYDFAHVQIETDERTWKILFSK
jgi:shikimate kinase